MYPLPCSLHILNSLHMQKLQERKAAFEKAAFKDSQEKEKWKSLLKMEVMSSDDSDHDGDKETIISHGSLQML